MNRHTKDTKEIMKALQKIQRYGKSEKTAITFLTSFCSSYNGEIQNWEDRPLERIEVKWANRCLAIAEIMSRLAPPSQKDAWYTAGLLHRLADLIRRNDEHSSRQIAAALLRRAGYSEDVVFCIYRYKTINDPREWSPMMAALIYADSHVDPDGEVLTSSECCGRARHLKSDTTDYCAGCMYARYLFAKGGTEDRCELVLLKLREDMQKSISSRETIPNMKKAEAEEKDDTRTETERKEVTS